MKKLIITCLSILSTMTIWAMDETVKIQIRPTKQGDKTETHIPEVDYDKEKNKLDVSFRSDGNYDVIIDDEDGETRCRFGLNTSGGKATICTAKPPRRGIHRYHFIGHKRVLW